MKRSRLVALLVAAVVLAAPSLVLGQWGRAGVLALRIGDEAMGLTGAAGGGAERSPGGRPQVQPFTVEGGADELSSLVEHFQQGSRFEGELVQTLRRRRQVVLSFDDAHATELKVPAVGARGGQLALAVTITPGSADVGPFESAEAQQRNRRRTAVWSRLRRAVRRLAPARAELEVQGLGEVTPQSVGEITLSHSPGGKVSASPVEVTLDRDDAEGWIESFEQGRRQGDLELRYLDRRGGETFVVSADRCRVAAVAPDLDSGGVRVRLTLSNPKVSAPTQ